MSITSSNNLAVNNSLTVNSNTILGVDNTSTLIINSKPTINSDLTINANIYQTSGNISSTGDITLNGNVVLTKTLTGVGATFRGITNNTNAVTNNSTLSQVGLASFGNDINLNSGQSVYIKNSGSTAFLRMHHSGAGAYIDYTNVLNLRNSTTSSASPIDTFNLNSSSNQGTFNYNLNTTGITNNTTALINNGVLTQNSTANINSDLNVTGIPYFIGTSANFPTTSSGANGLKIFWNVVGGSGITNFLNCAQGGSGGFSWYYTNASTVPTKLMNLDNNSNLSNLNDISCSTVTASSGISCNSITTPTVSLNSQSIYSVILFSNITGNGSNTVQKFLGNNGLAEVYLMDSAGSMAIYLPQSPSAGTKLTFRRIVGATTCNIYSYNSAATVLILSGQTNGTNVLSIANASGTTNATFVYYSSNWYQI